MSQIETAAILRLVDEYTAPANAVLGVSGKLDKTLRDTQKQLSHLKSDRADVAAFSQLKKQSVDTRREIEKQQKEVNRLAKEYHKAKEPTERLAVDMNNAKQELSELKKQVGATSKAYKDKKLTVKKLSDEYREAVKTTNVLNREFNTAKKKSAQLKSQHEKQSTSLHRLRKSLKEAGINTRKLSKHDRQLSRDLSNTTRSIREQERALKKYNAEMKRMRNLSNKAKSIVGKATMVGAGGLGMAWLGSRAISATGEYKALLADVAVTAGMSDKQVDQLTRRISTLTDTTFQSRKVLGEGAKVLIAAGLDLDKTLGSLPAIGKTATAADAEVQEVARTAFALLDNLKLPIQEIDRAMDMLTEAGKLGRFELRDMAQYFPSLTAQAKRLGLEGAEGVATLGAALQIALKGAADPAEAANNMKNFLAKVTSPETIKRAADIYGINLERELKSATKRGLNPLEFMLGRVHQLTKGDAFRVGELFGDLQVQQFLTPMMANLKEYEALKLQVLAASGTVDTDLKRRVDLDPTIGWRNLRDDLAELRDDAITPLLPVLRDLGADLKPIIQSFSGWVKENPKLAKYIMVTVASVIALMVVIAPLIALIASSFTVWAMWRIGMSKVFMPMDKVTKGSGRLMRLLKNLGRVLMWVGVKALPVVGKAILWIGRALMANPIGAIITVIGLAAYFIIKHWTPIKAFFGELWDGVKDGALMLWNFIVEYSPFGLLIKGVQKLKSLIKDFWGDKDNKIAVEATKHVKQLPANDPYYRSSVKPFDKNKKPVKGVSEASPHAPLRQSKAVTIKEIHSGSPTVIKVYGTQGMDVEELSKMVAKEVDKKNRESERRSRGRLHG